MPQPPQTPPSQPPQPPQNAGPANWYRPEADAESADAQPDAEDAEIEHLLGLTDTTAATAQPDVHWTASEFIAHQKGVTWYALLILIGVVLAAVGWFVTRDLLSVIVIVLVVGLFAASGGRKPRVLDYNLSHVGLEIGGKQYHYAEFRSFAVMKEGAFSSIMLIPLKRFMPPISIYYDPKDEQKIVDAISQYLPLEQRQHDIFDQIAARIRF